MIEETLKKLDIGDEDLVELEKVRGEVWKKEKKKTKTDFVIDTALLKQETKHKESILRKYDQGKISISKAAKETGLTVGEIEEYMVRRGYRSKYSTVDLERELELLER